MIGVVLDRYALDRVGTSPDIAGYITRAAHGKLYVHVPAAALFAAAVKRPEVGMHLLRLSHEIERERLHVSALHENSAVIAQWAHAQLIDDLPLAHAVFEAEALRWPLITTASGPLKKYRQLGVVTETLPDL